MFMLNKLFESESVISLITANVANCNHYLLTARTKNVQRRIADVLLFHLLHYCYKHHLLTCSPTHLLTFSLRMLSHIT